MTFAFDDSLTTGADTSIEVAAAARTPNEPELENFRRLAEVSAAMIWMADAAGLCTFVNQSWLTFCGRSVRQELGTGWADTIHPDDVLNALSGYWIAIRASAPVRIEYRILAKDGMYQKLERLGSPWVGVGGELRGYLGCITPSAAKADWETRRKLALLSGRERQVLGLIAAGHTTKEIADHLNIRYKTADSHRTHLLKKLGIHEIASLVRFAIRAEVISA
jgi:PAS domain S-box-containing protein